MPRPVKSRSSLPSHSKAAKIPTKLQEDDFEMENAEAGPSEPIEVGESIRLPTKQKKADKLYERREALLAKITAGVSPYSKSHNRRIKKGLRPSENLVTNLSAVEDVLQEMGAAQNAQDDEKDESGEGGVGKEVLGLPGGKGKEKLTVKKRQRVLADEAARLPAILSNPSFAKNPFETIRLHTLNTMEKQKQQAKPKQQQKKLRSG